jgi:thiamine-phosphate pyrophosphorylase
MYDLASNLRRITSDHGSKLLINDRVDVALACRADGVHCPEDGFPAAIARELLGTDSLIGVSCHSLESARCAVTAGADFVFFGHVFETASKTESPVGLGALRDVCKQIEIPVFAIGGITPERAVACMEMGAGGVAVISAILGADDIASSVRAFATTLGEL